MSPDDIQHNLALQDQIVSEMRQIAEESPIPEAIRKVMDEDRRKAELEQLETSLRKLYPE
jgi:uncharacterized protein (UPF0147 family)